MFRKKIKLKKQEIELEEIFLDKLLKEKKESSEIWERKLEVPLSRFNFWVLLFLGFLIMFSLLFFSFRLQIVNYDRYQALAEQNKFLTSYFSSNRGLIYDRNLKALISNEASFECFINKNELPKEEYKLNEIIMVLSIILNEDSNELKKTIEDFQKTNETELTIKRNLSHKELILLEAKKDDLPGFSIKKRVLRKYENQAGLSHLLGYLGKVSSVEMQKQAVYLVSDYTGKEGLEKFYEDVLKEKRGKIKAERTAQGKLISQQVVRYPESGSSIVLSLDLDLQERASQSLKNVMSEVSSKAGVFVALNPQSGDILAAVSLPDFDNNLFAKGITEEELKKLNEDPLHPQMNRLISGLYPIGSAVKPFIAASALEEQIIEQNTQLYCPLNLCLENKYSKQKECFSDWTFHGLSNVKKAIAESVNPFFYLIGGGYIAPSKNLDYFDPLLPERFDGLGIQKIEKYLKSFGFGKLTGIDLPGETAGRVPSPEWKKEYFKDVLQQIWYQGDTYNISIGQGYLTATPLELVLALAALTQDGNIIKPRLVKKIIDPSGKTIKEFGSEFVGTVLVSPENLSIVKSGMRQAVSSPSGSAYSLNFLPVKAAAKTGTAQIPKKDHYQNWIEVFAPYENPEIVIVVLIEEVQGMKVAAQKVARDVLEWYFTKNKNSPAAVENLNSTSSTSSFDFQYGL